MADLDILKGLPAMEILPALLELKTKKKVITSSFNHFSHTGTSARTPKATQMSIAQGGFSSLSY